MAKKKTHGEYVAELAIKNPIVEVVGEYSGANTKIMHRCFIDGYEWLATPHNILRGKGCPKCGIKSRTEKRSKAHDEYVAELLVKNPNVEAVEQYSGSLIKIKHRCLIHDVYWDTTPSRALQGVGCSICHSEKIAATKYKSNEQYVEEVKNISPHIIVIEPYVEARVPILHKCTIHNVEWKTSPDSILHGHGCYKCGNEKQHDKMCKTNEQYIEELGMANKNIVAVDTYISALIPILHKCLIDGYEWYAAPANILHGTGCPKCAGNTKKTHDEYVNEVSLLNPDIEVIGQYINARTPILHKCKIDGYIWSTVPYVILSGCGCPQCNDSVGERLVRQWLIGHEISYEGQKIFDDCKDKQPLPFDFYLPDYNMLIEYDGEQHYRPVEYFGGQESFEKTQKHDKIKTEYCKNNNIKLLRIPYFKDVKEELNNFLFI